MGRGREAAYRSGRHLRHRRLLLAGQPHLLPAAAQHLGPAPPAAVGGSTERPGGLSATASKLLPVPRTRRCGDGRSGTGLRSPPGARGQGAAPRCSDAGMEQVPVASAQARSQGCSARCTPGQKPLKAE
ncbi:Inactive Phospholipase C-Like Protein 1 [Manis pentadactyla]|nr:Inactive Phospholipase C-Like Protein 1 [Manis pentadactyla]